GGIAHDFNNVLAGMLGNLYVVRSQMKGSPQLVARLESIEQQGYGAAGMVRQLLSFSRKDVPDVKDIDLVPFTKELAKFASVSIPENIEFNCAIEDASLVSCCDPVQLQQSLLNLIVNATHALQERRDASAGQAAGRIELTAKSARLPKQIATYDDLSGEPRAWACISVRDNGIGMDQDTVSKIFEPFFTTKASDIGTGLGLAMVKGYVEALGGLIDVESVAGDGTCVSIYLPQSANQTCAPDDKTETLRRGHGELILVADDNSHVLEALSSILESVNYRVLTAVDGEHAMQIFDQHADQLDMAILDMVMPKASGMQAARHMLSMNRNFPVTLMTGYDKDGALLSKEDAGYMVLRKPWSLGNLNGVLECALKKRVNGAQASE
ncbi:MAG: ATP-binding protein, partial [Mariprofundaceae bacterium]|nr:ATP-binding protein [Mariprofundaceae bacterium]